MSHDFTLPIGKRETLSADQAFPDDKHRKKQPRISSMTKSQQIAMLGMGISGQQAGGSSGVVDDAGTLVSDDQGTIVGLT